MTLVELTEVLRREHGASFAPSTVWRFLDRHAMGGGTLLASGAGVIADIHLQV